MENGVRTGLMTKMINKDVKEIRVFAGGIGVVFQIIAVVSWWRGGNLYPYISGLGVVFAVVGLTLPKLMKPVYARWMIIAAAIGRFQTKLLLAILFYLVITPVGIVLRLLRKDILDLKHEPNAKTYWKKRDPMQGKERFHKQF
ncbi:SxtJ family membrane protein [Candidatus Desulfatibia sp.]|uniref:SxtJ family membrane protein n=1 Tax=Candidatus Desulfatibia sp. TaxID=3101189 RepID=UPI0039B903D8